jgi:hypothetical protein
MNMLRSSFFLKKAPSLVKSEGVLDIANLVAGYSVPVAGFLVVRGFTSSHLQLTTYHLLPTTYFLLLTSYFLLPTSYFLLLTSYYLLPTNFFSPLLHFFLFQSLPGYTIPAACLILSSVFIRSRLKERGTTSLSSFPSSRHFITSMASNW